MSEQTTDTASPRRPWLAVVANLGTAPLGHVYAGAPLRGVVITAAAIAAGVGALLLAVKVPSAAVVNASLISIVLLQLLPAVDAWRMVRGSGESYRLKAYNKWYIYLGLIAVLMVVGPAIRDNARKLVRAYKISAESMAPGLIAGDQILADNTAYFRTPPKRFDVVVFQSPEKADTTLLKRVIGLPGETVEVRNRHVWINGAPLDDPYAHLTNEETDSNAPKHDDMKPLQLDGESYFLMGDNRNHSYDSRFFGPIRGSSILSRVHTIYLSLIAEPLGIRWERTGMVVR